MLETKYVAFLLLGLQNSRRTIALFPKRTVFQQRARDKMVRYRSKLVLFSNGFIEAMAHESQIEQAKVDILVCQGDRVSYNLLASATVSSTTKQRNMCLQQGQTNGRKWRCIRSFVATHNSLKLASPKQFFLFRSFSTSVCCNIAFKPRPTSTIDCKQLFVIARSNNEGAR